MIRIAEQITYRNAGSDSIWIILPVVAATALYNSTEKNDTVGTLLEEKLRAVLSRKVSVPRNAEFRILFSNGDVVFMGSEDFPAKAAIRTSDRVELEAECVSTVL